MRRCLAGPMPTSTASGGRYARSMIRWLTGGPSNAPSVVLPLAALGSTAFAALAWGSILLVPPSFSPSAAAPGSVSLPRVESRI
ncbi:hypothetical protein C9J85_09105 [Haloferax sp. wsp5]|nr:hypothetical protein C9J85_09105 [Haloferax sp. wsp5]